MGICAAVYSVVRSTACRCLQAPLSFVVKFPLKTEPKVETVMKALYWTLFEFYSMVVFDKNVKYNQYVMLKTYYNERKLTTKAYVNNFMLYKRTQTAL